MRTIAAYLVILFYTASWGMAEVQSIFIGTFSPLNSRVEFDYRFPTTLAKAGTTANHEQVLMLVPGYNGSGKAWIEGENEWTRFADREGLILIAPTFETNLQEIQQHKGYYYPEQWSGNATLQALQQLHQRTGAGLTPKKWT